jgi:proton glutamate symport protein
LLILAALSLWAAGIAVAGANHSTTALSLRLPALAIFLAVALRKPSLLLWTFLAMVAGVETGLDLPRVAALAQFPCDLFLRLIRMAIAPLLLASIPAAIAAHSNLRSVGRVAIKSLIYFEVVTTIGLAVGSLAASISGAGWGVVLPPPSEALTPATQQTAHGWQQIALNLFPDNIARAVAENQILQVAIFALLFGTALAMLPEKKKAPLVAVLQSLADAIFQLVRIFVYLAPLAAGSSMAYAVGRMGPATLIPLAKLVVTYYATAIGFCLLVLLPILLLFRIPLRSFINAVAEPAAIGFATTASEAALPLAMERMEGFGVPRWIVSFVMPAGYSFNMTGSSIYLSMAAVFAAQAAGMHLTLAQHAAVLGTLMLTSKGLAGVPRAVIVILLASAAAIDVPPAAILLLLGIDTLMDMGRTALNIIGNSMAAAVMARCEGVLDPRGPDSASRPH